MNTDKVLYPCTPYISMSSYPLYPLSANHVHKLSADTQSFAPEITFEKTPRFLGKVYDKVIVFSLTFVAFIEETRRQTC